MPSLHLRPDERFAAWLVTGPIGHLLAGAIDWVTLLIGWSWARRRGRRR